MTIGIVVVLFDAGAPVFASRAQELVKEAQRLTQKAEVSDTASERDESYKKAIAKYNEVIKKHSNTLEAVEAQYGIARIHHSAKRGEYRDLYKAYEAYKALIVRYDRPDRALAQNFEAEEIKQIRQIVESAKKHKDEVARQLDEQNRAKTLYKIMDFFVAATGRVRGFSYWFAVILVTLIVKLAMTPLTKAQFRSMKEMQRIAPLVKKIQEEYKGDQKAIGEKTMELYKEHNVNPFASCLPLLVQMPVLWLLYHMIRTYEFQFAKGTFLWIGSPLSHLYGVTVPFFGGQQVWITARSLAEPDAILVLLYTISMFVSTKLSAVDPQAAEQQKTMAIVMPIMFAFIFAGFPSAFLLYWLVFNVIQTVQQYLILRPDPGAAALAPGPIPAGQPRPANPANTKETTDAAADAASAAGSDGKRGAPHTKPPEKQSARRRTSGRRGGGKRKR